jgi:hypothetical protein
MPDAREHSKRTIRMEAKLDAILRTVNKNGDKLIEETTATMPAATPTMSM